MSKIIHPAPATSETPDNAAAHEARGVAPAAYTIAPARYAKGKLVVQCPSPNGYKTRAARLIEAKGIGGRYVGRYKGYVASQSAAARFEKLYAEGWDASIITGELEPPRA